jgi:hypothetical protein
MQIKILFLSLLLPSFALCQEKILIIDTSNNDLHTYRNFNLLAESTGFKPNVKPFYEVSPQLLNNYQAIFLDLDGSFLIAIAKELAANQTIKDPLLKHAFSLINALSKRSNSSIGIIVPVSNSKSIAIFSLIKQILNKLGLDINNKSLALFLDNALSHFMHSDASKSYQYDTALLYKRKQTAKDNIEIEPIAKEEKFITTMLPQNKEFMLKAAELRPLYPLGIVIKNQQPRNNFFITSKNYLHVADINEPFMLNPIDSALRHSLLLANLAMLSELNHKQSSTAVQTFPHILTDHYIAEKKKQVCKERKHLATNYQWTNNEGIACGWMHLDPFHNNEEVVAEHILQSGLNMLWLQLRPEWYLSDNCSQTEDQKATYFKQISRFTAALKKKASDINKTPPHLFIGMELSGNFGTKPVNQATSNIYGTHYSKIPAPLDYENYWKKEVIEVFDRFSDHWHQSLGNGLALAGVFLDFEMYHAQNQTGQYTSIMDFSDHSWHLYTKKTNNQMLSNLKTTKDRITYLLQNKQLTNYFSILEHEAQIIGQSIKDHIHKTLPDCIIAAYNINLPHSWFYKGMLAGLSSPKKPVIFASFNNDFYSHYDWLVKNNINLIHLPVILFSKLRDKKDFNLINQLAQQHDGIWFNRYSWLEQPKSAETSFDLNVESSPLDSSLVIELMNKHIKLIQANFSKCLPQKLTFK